MNVWSVDENSTTSGDRMDIKKTVGVATHGCMNMAFRTESVIVKVELSPCSLMSCLGFKQFNHYLSRVVGRVLLAEALP